MRTLFTALLVVPVFALAGACVNVQGKVVGNHEDTVACPHPPKTFALSVETAETHVNSEGVEAPVIRTVCVDAGLAGSYKVGSNYP